MRTAADVPCSSSRRRSHRPTIVDQDADRVFRDLARKRGLDPDARFVGGYVEWEWAHARHVFDGLVAPVRGREVLELGCNLGATAIVLAALGAVVTAVDVDAGLVEIARANAARYGLGEIIQFVHVPDTTRLPFGEGRFDWVSCNSVLEYVAPETLAAVLGEIDRVLGRGGIAAVIGTSNRAWPREDHSRRLFVNYVPRALDPWLFGDPPARGVCARDVRRVLRDYDDLTRQDGGDAYVEMKRRMGVHGWKLVALGAASAALSAIGVSPGTVAPTLSLLLRKRDVTAGCARIDPAAR
jgi:SAM-dependent methyltransferase